MFSKDLATLFSENSQQREALKLKLVEKRESNKRLQNALRQGHAQSIADHKQLQRMRESMVEQKLRQIHEYELNVQRASAAVEDSIEEEQRLNACEDADCEKFDEEKRSFIELLHGKFVHYDRRTCLQDLPNLMHIESDLDRAIARRERELESLNDQESDSIKNAELRRARNEHFPLETKQSVLRQEKGVLGTNLHLAFGLKQKFKAQQQALSELEMEVELMREVASLASGEDNDELA